MTQRKNDIFFILSHFLLWLPDESGARESEDHRG